MDRYRFVQKPIGAKKMKRLNLIAVAFFVVWFVIFLSLIVLYIFEAKYHNKVFSGIKLGNINIGGLNRSQLEKVIEDFKSNLENRGIIFIYKNTQTQIFPQAIATSDPDLSYNLINIDKERTVRNIFLIGRSGSLIDDIKTQIKVIRSPIRAELRFSILYNNLKDTLKENFKSLEIPAKNARLKINSDLSITIIGEEYGIIPDYDTALKTLGNNLSSMSLDNIIIPSKRDYPQIKALELGSKRKELLDLFLKKESLSLIYKQKKWNINKQTYKDWIDVKNNKLIFNKGILDYIKENISKDIEITAQEARFKLTKTGRVIEFKPSRDGIQIDYDNTLKNINNKFFLMGNDDNSAEIVVKIIKPKYTTESINNLGIKEIIGVGKSNFKGSPPNRKHNIKVGADALNGILIPPGEEFSLVKSLGEIDAEHGYLPELVIKGNKTIPEYGGGLCQIGTTLFRGSIQSGLPITERRNHSYRVSYYEPAGTDCTIYNPRPDCKFINDTGNHILLQTYTTKDDDLIFEFWGTKDGRKVTITDPVIYNITEPPPTKYIETESLEPGETKCTERAHKGAEAKFDYIVEYPDGRRVERTFYSYYKPWQAVCLVGKEKSDRNYDQDK